MAEILQGGKRDTTGQTAAFTITNFTQDLDMDCNASADAVICDVLATLIRELIRKGIINGTVA